MWSEIISKSVPYYRYNVAEAIANLKDAFAFCEFAWNEIYKDSFDEWSDYETNFEPRVIYRTTDSGISANMLRTMMERFDGFEDALSVVNDVVEYYYDRFDELPEEAQKLEQLYDE